MNTRELFRDHGRFLAFGFLLTFFCNIGQTFFIGFYNTSIRETFDLSDSAFGSIYGIASLMSATTLIWAGRLIDRIDLRWYTLYVLCGVVMACGLMAWSPNIMVMGVALYLLRLTGQGLMPHISSTSMGRYFEAGRGKAVSIAGLGITGSQIILPSIAVGAIAVFGWQQSWLIYGGFFLLIVIPLVLFMLKGHTARREKWEAEIAVASASTVAHSRMKTGVYRALFTDKNFYILLPAILATPFIGTAFFFFQEKFVAVKGWEMDAFALSYSFMAVSGAISSLLVGYLCDRFTALNLTRFYLLPFALALILFITFDHVAILFIGMMLIGLSQGAMMTLNGAIWPELYGTEVLGAIRSMMVSLMVFSTASAPAITGFLYDSGVDVSSVFAVFATYMLAASGLQLCLKRT